jgi:hypothetical protein
MTKKSAEKLAVELVHSERPVLALRLAKAIMERDAWKNLCALQDQLLACYRVGRNPGALLDRLAKARAIVADTPGERRRVEAENQELSAEEHTQRYDRMEKNG